ncbi:TPA: LOW QUALITY PROTEIN: hypothetical protein N0F65_010585 [Lagenidium giganteum]|uniref:Protein ARV n=1 Tax=Lagenidium giganteum TaxID=4803 RepID=A0AAV2ZEP9_9STRA|nr:TPA: LOW QUALITY PROTEIN: hypothetical protein N0F65_010585 [Lagenidium giganteum]
MAFVGWPLGLFLSAISSIFGIVGKLFLKLAHNQREREEEDEERRHAAGNGSGLVGTASSKIWFMYFYSGLFSMLVINPALSAVAYCFATQSLLAPMAGLTIGWNTLFGPLLLPHERLTTNDFVGAMLIFTGCVLVGVSGTHESPPIPVDRMWKHFFSASFIIYAVVLAVVLLFLIHHARPALVFSWQASPSKARKITTEQAQGWISRGDLSQLSRVCMSVLAGVVSGQLFFLAALMRLLHDEGHVRIWTYAVTYVCIVGAIGLALLGLYLLNAALKVEDAVVVIYLYEASYILSGAISGLCFFRDMKHLSSWHYVVYSLSLAIILLGIYVVARRSTPVEEEEEKGHLLPLLVAPSVDDASTCLIFQKASYFAARRSSSPRRSDHAVMDAEGRNRRKSLPFVVAPRMNAATTHGVKTSSVTQTTAFQHSPIVVAFYAPINPRMRNERPRCSPSRPIRNRAEREQTDRSDARADGKLLAAQIIILYTDMHTYTRSAPSQHWHMITQASVDRCVIAAVLGSGNVGEVAVAASLALRNVLHTLLATHFVCTHVLDHLCLLLGACLLASRRPTDRSIAWCWCPFEKCPATFVQPSRNIYCVIVKPLPRLDRSKMATTSTTTPANAPPVTRDVLCVECGASVPFLVRDYGKGNVRLAICGSCNEVADKYVEYENTLLFLEVMLLKPQVYRHVLYNLPTPLSNRTIMRMFVILVMLDMNVKAYLIDRREGVFFRSESMYHDTHGASGLRISQYSLHLVVLALLENVIYFCSVFAFIYSDPFGRGWRDKLLTPTKHWNTSMVSKYTGAMCISSFGKMFALLTVIWEYHWSFFHVIGGIVFFSNVLAIELFLSETPNDVMVAVPSPDQLPGLDSASQPPLPTRRFYVHVVILLAVFMRFSTQLLLYSLGNSMIFYVLV